MKKITMLRIASINLMLLSLISCGKSIAKDVAINKAIERVELDSLMVIDFDYRDQEIIEEDNNWHVSFPYKSSTNMRGGEPHVLVDIKTGEIIKVMYTR